MHWQLLDLICLSAAGFRKSVNSALTISHAGMAPISMRGATSPWRAQTRTAKWLVGTEPIGLGLDWDPGAGRAGSTVWPRAAEASMWVAPFGSPAARQRRTSLGGMEAPGTLWGTACDSPIIVELRTVQSVPWRSRRTNCTLGAI